MKDVTASAATKNVTAVVTTDMAWLGKLSSRTCSLPPNLKGIRLPRREKAHWVKLGRTRTDGYSG